MMKTLMMAALGFTLISSPAFAKAPRHCVDKDKKEMAVTSAPGQSAKMACKAAGGMWVKVKHSKHK